MIDYLNDNGPAFTFIATVILAAITGVYVYFTWRLAEAQKEATRQGSEPVLVPEVTTEDGEIKLIVTNVGLTLATGIMLYPKAREDRLVIDGPLVRAALRPGESAAFPLVPEKVARAKQMAEMPGEWADEMASEVGPPLDPDGGFELLYSDGLDRTLIHTSIDVMQYRHPVTNEARDEWWLMTPVLRERHTRDALMKKVSRRGDSYLREIHENSPCADLWVGAYGVMMGC